MKEYVPNPVIVRRAVELWCREIVRGRHDNGDRSHAGFMAEMLASMIPSNAADESVLGAFGCALEQLLLNKTAFTKDELKPRIELSECGRYQDSLHTDYGPDVTLATAAETAGLKCEMPWKSHTWLYEDKLSARFGYSAQTLYHYPLDDNGWRWAVTSLHGENHEVVRLVKSVLDGNPLGLQIEESATCQALANRIDSPTC